MIHKYTGVIPNATIQSVAIFRCNRKEQKSI